MQIAKWIRERLGAEVSENDADDAAKPAAAADDDEQADEADDDPSVYPLW